MMFWAALSLPLALAAPSLLNSSWVKEVEGEEANAVQQIMAKPHDGAMSATSPDFAWNGASMAVALALLLLPICFSYRWSYS